MKKTFFSTAAAAGLSLLFAGCAATSIADLEITPFDRESASNEYGAQVQEKIDARAQMKLAVSLVPSEEINEPMEQFGSYLNDKLAASLGELSYFYVAPTKHLGAMIAMNQTAEALGEDTDDVELETTDLMLTYKLASCDFKQNEILAVGSTLAAAGAGAAGAFGGPGAGAGAVGAASAASQFDSYAQAVLNVTLLDLEDQSTLNFSATGKTALCPKTEDNQKKAIDEAVSILISQIAIKFGPPGKVITTKGEGTAAQINLGKRFGAQVGSTVDFFEYTLDEDSGELIEIPIASGLIIEDDIDYLEDKKCWVRIEKPGLIKKNTLVRLRGFDR